MSRSQERWLLRRLGVRDQVYDSLGPQGTGAGVALQPSLRQPALGGTSASPSFSSGRGLASLVRPAPGAGLDSGLEGSR